MSSSPAASRWLIWLLFAGMFGLTIGAQLLLTKSTPGEAGSTFSSNTRGAQALFELARQLELEPRQHRRALLEPLPQTVAQVWMLQPAIGPSAEESDELLNWVASGGTLLLVTKTDPLLAPDQPFAGLGQSSLRPLLAETKIEQQQLAKSDLEALTPLAPWAGVPWDLPTPAGSDLQGLATSRTLPGHALGDQLPDMLAIPSAGSGGWSLATFDITVLGSRGTRQEVLIDTATGPVMIERTHGLGRIVALTQTEWVTNALLPGSVCGEFAASLLTYRTRPGQTLFLEQVHGHQGQLRSLSDLMAASWGRLLLWLGSIVLLAILSASVRFVAPLTPPAAPRPEPGEYVEALGRLYSRAGAWDTVLYNLSAYFRHTARGPQQSATAHLALQRRRRSQRIVDVLDRSSDRDLTPTRMQSLLNATELDPPS